MGPGERYGALHNIVGHSLLVLWPRVGLWIHNRTPETVTRRRARRR